MIDNMSTFKLLGATLLGFASTGSGYIPFPENQREPDISNDQAGIFQGFLPHTYTYPHPREVELKQLFHSSSFKDEDPKTYLEFQESGKDKTLYLVGEDDPGEALNPKNNPKILKILGRAFDLKYQGIRSVDDACNAIGTAAKRGNLKNIILYTHGHSKGICFSNCKRRQGWLHLFANHENCFKGLDDNTRIFLFGSETGAQVAGGNIAQKIARDAKRAVVASPGKIYPSRVTVSRTSPLEFHHPNHRWFSRNKQGFHLFFPQYRKCTPIPDMPHSREKAAVKAVKKQTLADSTLHYPEGFENNILQICEDNPKKKILFLSMNYDHNSALEPKHTQNTLKALSTYYDVRYKQVFFFEEICELIKESSQFGKIKHLILSGHGSRPGIHISGDQIDDNSLNRKRDFSCFDYLPPEATIWLFSCKTGQPNENTGDVNDNFAHTLAQKTGRKVVASPELVYSSYTTLASVEPLEFFHPRVNSLKRESDALKCKPFDSVCKENDFKIFYPMARWKRVFQHLKYKLFGTPYA